MNAIYTLIYRFFNIIFLSLLLVKNRKQGSNENKQ